MPGMLFVDLIGQALAHEAGADDADADRLSLRLACLQSGIDEDHGYSLAVGRAHDAIRVFNFGLDLASSSNS